ncbi:MAG: hypothetical protein J1F25_06475, partial [Prevotellaceae bacterium]|nr:hypothetical protein [Prevotellaceae bacterium]
MKRLFRYICYALLLPMLAIATSCTDDSMVPDSLTDLREGMVNVTFTLQFPQATTVATRTMGDMPARNLDLYLFVFDNNVLKQKLYIPASQQNFSTGEVFSTFKADLSTTDGNAVVHLVAIDDPDKVFADALNALELFGTESNVMFNAYFPTTANGQDAYWQRVELGMPITKKGNGEVADEVKAKLQRIPMIRNFAKVSMEDRTNNTFELTGFEVINVRDRGTIVPAFTDGEGNTKFAIFDTQTLGGKDNYYAKILEQGYTGRNAAGAARINDKRTE